jgi:hypothetical protein
VGVKKTGQRGLSRRDRLTVDEKSHNFDYFRQNAQTEAVRKIEQMYSI